MAFFLLFGRGRGPRPNSKKKKKKATAQTAKQKTRPAPSKRVVVFAVWAGGRVIVFAVWAGGFFFAVWAGGVFFCFAVWAGDVLLFCCLGGCFFLLFGWGRVFFFAVWAGDGSSLTYRSAWLVFKRPNNKNDQTAKKKKNTGSLYDIFSYSLPRNSRFFLLQVSYSPRPIMKPPNCHQIQYSTCCIIYDIV